MSNLRSTIESLASQFASNILDALRGASLDELADIAGRGNPSGSFGSARRGRPRNDASQNAHASDNSVAVRRRGRGGRLGRRTPNEISRVIESIVELLQKNGGGLRAEQIRSALGVEAKELPRPLADALSAGRLTKTGQKRATTYFAAGGGSAASRGAAGGAGGPKRRGRKPGSKNKKR